MDNPEKLATLSTQDEDKTKQRTQHNMLDTTLRKQTQLTYKRHGGQRRRRITWKCDFKSPRTTSILCGITLFISMLDAVVRLTSATNNPCDSCDTQSGIKHAHSTLSQIYRHT